MNLYHVRFKGRTAGALGVMQPFSFTRRAESIYDVKPALYETHEHISGLCITLVDEDQCGCDCAKVVTCGGCHASWCERCDPAPSALCHVCHGRGYTTARVRRGSHE